MDKYMSSRDIYEQYIDAATALVMDQYATAMQESMAASTDDNTEISEGLDRRCRKLIKKRLARKQRKYAAKKLLRFTGMATMIVVMLFGVAGILFTTVEAIRVPIINFFIEQKDGYMEISGTEVNGSGTDSGNTQTTEGSTNETDPFAEVLPEGYELIMYDIGSAGNTFVMYENMQGECITIAVEPSHGILHVDTEEAVSIEETTVLSYDAIITEKDGCQITWLNTDTNLLYLIDATNLSLDEIKNLAENVENFY